MWHVLIYVADSTILYSSVCKTNVPVYECIATDWILIGNVREECICSSDQINFLHALLKKCKTFFFLKHTGRAALPILGHMGYPARIASYLQQTIISE